MEGITHLVAESLARNGFISQLDHRRLQWSTWRSCEQFTGLLAPGKPGVYEVGEAMAGRTLLVSQVADSEDLGMTLARASLPGKACYVRYAVIEDLEQRLALRRSLQECMPSESVQGFELAAADAEDVPSTSTKLDSEN